MTSIIALQIEWAIVIDWHQFGLIFTQYLARIAFFIWHDCQAQARGQKPILMLVFGKLPLYNAAW